MAFSRAFSSLIGLAFIVIIAPLAARAPLSLRASTIM
jgi:hypothetical protein